jgi:hypothetical protein
MGVSARPSQVWYIHKGNVEDQKLANNSCSVRLTLERSWMMKILVIDDGDNDEVLMVDDDGNEYTY